MKLQLSEVVTIKTTSKINVIVFRHRFLVTIKSKINTYTHLHTHYKYKHGKYS